MRGLLIKSYINSEIFTGSWREINYCNRCAHDPNYWDFPHPPFPWSWQNPGCFEPGRLQFVRRSALVRSSAPFWQCALLRTCVCALLRFWAHPHKNPPLEPLSFRGLFGGSRRELWESPGDSGGNSHPSAKTTPGKSYPIASAQPCKPKPPKFRGLRFTP